MGVTIKDVANDAKLSIATVSNYINGIPVKPENAQKIERSIKKLNYHVNYMARSLKTQQSFTLGIVVPSVTDIFHLQIVAEIDAYVSRFGYNLLICDCKLDAKVMEEKIHFLINKQVDGIFISPIMNNPQKFPELISSCKLPVVLFDQQYAENYDTVITDNEQTGYNITKHLISKQHRRIAMICGPDDSYTANERLHGYRRALEENGISYDPSLVFKGDYSTQSGYDGLTELFSRSNKPTAVFASNYHSSTGALLAAKEMGLRINEDVDFFLFDNLDMSNIFSPKLPVATQPIKEVGRTCAEIMLQRIKNDYSDFPKTVVLKNNLLF